MADSEEFVRLMEANAARAGAGFAGSAPCPHPRPLAAFLRRDFWALLSVLRRRFGPCETGDRLSPNSMRGCSRMVRL